MGKTTMIEVGVVIGLDGGPIYWHDVPENSVASIPDSQALWDCLWENRKRISGIAHTHPGSGVPSPSSTDLTTFAALESSLSKRPFRRLKWWIASSDRLIVAEWGGPGLLDYECRRLDVEPGWLPELRRRSKMGGRGA